MRAREKIPKQTSKRSRFFAQRFSDRGPLSLKSREARHTPYRYIHKQVTAFSAQRFSDCRCPSLKKRRQRKTGGSSRRQTSKKAPSVPWGSANLAESWN